MAIWNKRYQAALASILLLLATLAVYWPVSRFEFINFDDPDYVTANQFVTQGLTWKGTAWAFQTFHAANWHPLTWLSHMLDVQLFGMQAGRHHLMNLLLHLANTIVLFLVLRNLTGALWRSAFVAALFALHPLHVESVAWVAERKDVLSTFFGLLALWAYARYSELSRIKFHVSAVATVVTNAEPRLPGRKRAGKGTLPPVSCSTLHAPRSTPSYLFYALALFLFACSLMSKPMLATLPFLLLLLDYWPLLRLHPKTLLPLLWEKVPFFLLAVLSSTLTLFAQAQSGSVVSLENTPLALRIISATMGYLTYLEKTFWPHSLAMFYPFRRDWDTRAVLCGGFVLLLLFLWALVSARRRPWITVGWLWFLGALVPVIGLVQAGAQAVADRYTYLPLTGVFISVVWGVAELLNRWRYGRVALTALGFAAVVACTTATVAQLPYWHNTETLCRHALGVTTGNFLAHGVLGTELLNLGKFKEAEAELAAALELHPGYSLALSSLGKVLLAEGRETEAAALFQRTVERYPRDASAHFLLASLVVTHDKAVAASHFERTEDLLRDALRRQPEDIESRRLLAALFSAQKRTRELRDEYEEMLRLVPDWPEVLNNLAWLLATTPNTELRNGPQAVALAERACRLTEGTNLWMLATLAAAYAEAGRFADAVATQQRVCALAVARAVPAQTADPSGALAKTGQSAEPSGSSDLLRSTKARLGLYRSGRAYYEP